MVHHYAKLFELMPLDIRIAFRFYLLAVPHRRKGFSYNLLVHVYAELRISARCLSLIAQMSHHHIGMHTSSVNASVDACLSEPEHSTRWAEKVSHAQLLLRTLVALRHRPSKTLATRVIQGLLWSTQTALAEQTVRVMLQAGVKLAQPLVDLVMMQHGHRMLDGVSRYVVSLSTSSRRTPCSAQPRGRALPTLSTQGTRTLSLRHAHDRRPLARVVTEVGMVLAPAAAAVQPKGLQIPIPMTILIHRVFG